MQCDPIVSAEENVHTKIPPANLNLHLNESDERGAGGLVDCAVQVAPL